MQLCIQRWKEEESIFQYKKSAWHFIFPSEIGRIHVYNNYIAYTGREKESEVVRAVGRGGPTTQKKSDQELKKPFVLDT